MNQRTAIVLALIGAAVLAVVCWFTFFSEEPKSPFEKLTATYQKLTVPANAESVNASKITTKRYSADAHWEFETEWDWARYREWLKSQMEGKFRIAKESDHELIFRRTEFGDAYSVTAEKLAEGTPLRIRIKFVGVAF